LEKEKISFFYKRKRKEGGIMPEKVFLSQKMEKGKKDAPTSRKNSPSIQSSEGETKFLHPLINTKEKRK